METFLAIPVMTFVDTDAWQSWLGDNHTDQTGVWIKIAKKDSGIPTVTYAQALDEALCHGWIDGQRRGYDEKYFLQKFTPRRKKSLWSQVNIGKVEALIQAGRMQAAGHEAIAAAKADGRWDAAYEPQSTATIPLDFLTALNNNKQAKQTYDSLNKADQYSYLWGLMTAKTPEIRATRILKMIEKLTTDKNGR